MYKIVTGQNYIQVKIFLTYVDLHFPLSSSPKYMNN